MHERRSVLWGFRFSLLALGHTNITRQQNNNDLMYKKREMGSREAQKDKPGQWQVYRQTKRNTRCDRRWDAYKKGQKAKTTELMLLKMTYLCFPS